MKMETGKANGKLICQHKCVAPGTVIPLVATPRCGWEASDIISIEPASIQTHYIQERRGLLC